MKIYLYLLLSVFFLLGIMLSDTASADEHGGHEHSDGSSFSFFSLVRPLGIATLCFLFATFLTGLFRRKLRRKFIKIHLLLGAVSVVLGLTHGILVFILFG